MRDIPNLAMAYVNLLISQVWAGLLYLQLGSFRSSAGLFVQNRRLVVLI